MYIVYIIYVSRFTFFECNVHCTFVIVYDISICRLTGTYNCESCR